LQSGLIEAALSNRDYATDIQPITYEDPYENNVDRLPNERALYCIQLCLARNDTAFFNVFAGFFHYPMRRSIVAGVCNARRRMCDESAGPAFSLVKRSWIRRVIEGSIEHADLRVSM
jgi:hypothetical protein